MNRPIIGMSWPFRFENGRVAASVDTEHLKDNAMNIISTARGELLMKPDFGCDIHRRVFDPTNTLSMADADIREAIGKYEPRIQIIDVSLES